jgi:hypothetical protein
VPLQPILHSLFPPPDAISNSRHYYSEFIGY